MTKKCSFFLALSIASLFFLFSVTTRAAKGAETAKFLSTEEVVARLSKSTASRTPASIAFGVTNDHVDLRANDSPVVSQFGGTCSAFGTAAVMDNVLRANGINKTVSRRDLWNMYGAYDADYAVQAASKNYITELQYYPDSGTRAPDYKEKRSLKISQTTHHSYNFEGAIRALDQKHPVVFAVRVPSDLSNCKPTVSEKSYRTKGHHVMAAVGYHLDAKVAGGGYFILKNSWGTKCGDQGYHYYPFELCKRNDLYCYAIEVNSVESR
jgi:C1A family cysteine protease